MVDIRMDYMLHERCRKDFKNFLYVVFKHINLPSPTPLQYAVADELQYAEDDLGILGFRGLAKSTLTGIFVDWRFDRNPEHEQILYVGANQAEAISGLKFSRNLMDIVPFLEYLKPDVAKGQRDSALQFDVRPAEIRKQPSCKALGIFGNLTGNRATLIVSDDIETSENCDTQIKREHTDRSITEYRQIIAPLKGQVLYLGTPHTEVSVYNKIYDKGTPIRIFPIKYPTKEQQQKYGDKLAPYITDKVLEDETLVGKSTDPERFGEEDILKLEAEGRSKFAMQQMLDTTLSDTERYPLKCSDLIVMDCDKKIAPEKVAYGSAPNQILKDIPCYGIANDKFYSPIPIPDIKWQDYNYKVMTIDPSGRGEDELAFDIGGVLNSQIFLLKQGGIQGGYTKDNLIKLAKLAKEYKVHKIKIESNFGDGMFTALFLPILKEIGHQCTVEEVRHNTQKERRIIDTLEPVMNQHRLIIDKTLIKEDYESIKIYPADKQQQYSLFYQLTRITRDRGALRHDDRLDCLAMLVADCLEMMSDDIDAKIQQRMDEEFEKEIERIYGFSDNEEEIGWFDL